MLTVGAFTERDSMVDAPADHVAWQMAAAVLVVIQATNVRPAVPIEGDFDCDYVITGELAMTTVE